MKHLPKHAAGLEALLHWNPREVLVWAPLLVQALARPLSLTFHAHGHDFWSEQLQHWKSGCCSLAEVAEVVEVAEVAVVVARKFHPEQRLLPLLLWRLPFLCCGPDLSWQQHSIWAWAQLVTRNSPHPLGLSFLGVPSSTLAATAQLRAGQNRMNHDHDLVHGHAPVSVAQNAH